MRALFLSCVLILAGCAAESDPGTDVIATPTPAPDPATLDADSDGYTAATDCNDAVASVYPGALETCNNTDDDCDGEADDGYTLTKWYVDADGDGYAGPATAENSILACLPPNGYASSSPADCDDADPDYSPATTEVCDGVDQNCDGTIDEGLVIEWFYDHDGDGYGYDVSDFEACKNSNGDFYPIPSVDSESLPYYVPNNDDCNDGNANAYPDAAELCDGINNDCDQIIDEGC